eukprot:178087_1
MAEQDIESLSYKQLKERCVMTGISACGTKKQLLIALRSHYSENEPNNTNIETFIIAAEEKKEISDDRLSVHIDESSPYNEAVRYPCACVVDPGSVLIFGGYDNKNMKTCKSISTVWFYNVSINQYIEMKSLPYSVHCHTAAKTPDGRIVLVGSYEQPKQMIVYTPFTKQQDHEIEELPFSVGEAPSIVFDDDNNLHVLGGGKTQRQHLIIKWAKNKSDRKIIKLVDLPNGISSDYSGICHHKNKLYLMGSYYGKKNTLCIYDIAAKKWESGANIPLNRSGFGCHLINDCQDIILIGDGYGGKDSDIILLYNIATNKWRKSETKLKHPIGFHASALFEERKEIHGFSGAQPDKNVSPPATHEIENGHRIL